MGFLILLGASIFSWVFWALRNNIVMAEFYVLLSSRILSITAFVMLAVFLLGLIPDFIEMICTAALDVEPALLAMGLAVIGLVIMLAVNLQTSFLAPLFRFPRSYFRGAAPASLATSGLCGDVIPYIIIQSPIVGLLALWQLSCYRDNSNYCRDKR